MGVGLVVLGARTAKWKRTCLWLLLVTIAGVALAACGGAQPATGASAKAELFGEAVMSPGTAPAPDFNLQDQNGQTISLSGLRGRVVALTFLYSQCVQACPIIGEQLGQAERALGTKVPLALVVVSVSPQTDTADSVRAFAARHRWIGEWHWLLGPASQLAAVWKAYGIDVEPVQNGNLPHSVVLYLLDRGGYERVGLLFTDPGRIEQDVRILASA